MSLTLAVVVALVALAIVLGALAWRAVVVLHERLEEAWLPQARTWLLRPVDHRLSTQEEFAREILARVSTLEERTRPASERQPVSRVYDCGHAHVAGARTRAGVHYCIDCHHRYEERSA